MSDLLLQRLEFSSSDDNTYLFPHDDTELTQGIYQEDLATPPHRGTYLPPFDSSFDSPRTETFVGEGSMTQYCNEVEQQLEDEAADKAYYDFAALFDQYLDEQIDDRETTLCYHLKKAMELKSNDFQLWQMATLGFHSAIVNKPEGEYLNTAVFPLSLQIYVKYMNYLREHPRPELRLPFRF